MYSSNAKTNLLDDFYLKEASSLSQLAMVLCRKESPVKYTWADISIQVRKLASYIESLNVVPFCGPTSQSRKPAT